MAVRTSIAERGFTLVELLVVVAVIALLAAILMPAFASAKSAAKATSCLSNIKETGMAVTLYVDDFDGGYPQTRKTSSDPAKDDADGSMEEPDYGPTWRLVRPYAKTGDALAHCPEDPDPTGSLCDAPFPDHPDLHSYITNGWFAFGLKEPQVKAPAETVYIAERRSSAGPGGVPYCNYLYRPWFNLANHDAPENDMDAESGAVSTKRHHQANYGFADTHVKSLPFAATFNLENGTDLHKP
ncbi:MAG: prepilin-type N-terminal cleavage/methylation domain-containing protein [Fimbriimonadaceae bacterium]|nr:prepilin-type N-terminal cleavage/methylation domain-containing protein [Fimbriimonadaceae bacterium]